LTKLVFVVIALLFPLAALADDDSRKNERSGVGEARDSDHGNRDAGQKHWWTGWGFGESSRDIRKDDDHKDDHK
jgi:hypothetical protein